MNRVLTLAAALALVLGSASAASAASFWFDSTDTPLLIPADGSTSGTTTSMIITDAGNLTTINELDVFLNLEHTWTGDLEITLTHEDTLTSVLLFNNHGGSGDDILDVIFDDEAATAIGAGVPPFGPGSFIPDSALSAFDGESVAGTWTLLIDDQVGQDSGTLLSWGLHGDADVVPEPGAATLFGVGSLVVAAALRRRRQ